VIELVTGMQLVGRKAGLCDFRAGSCNNRDILFVSRKPGEAVGLAKFRHI
jgi:hypothetical protein